MFLAMLNGLYPTFPKIDERAVLLILERALVLTAGSPTRHALWSEREEIRVY